MNDYIIITDSTSDLPEDFCIENNIGIVYLSCLLDGVTYNKDNVLKADYFYGQLREGKMPTTSQVNPEEAREEFISFSEKYQCKNILYIALSSELSGTFQSVSNAARELMEENGEYNITVIDSLSASLGEGLLVYTAVSLRKKGYSLSDNASYIESHKLNLCHLFTVDDLFHLERGGRISKTTAMLGTIIGIKPLLHVDDVGRLVNIGKCRGRKKSLAALTDMMEERIGSYRDKNDVVFISHGDCLEDAQEVQNLIKDRFGIDSFVINHVSPVIGSHSGPGTMAIFFFGDFR